MKPHRMTRYRERRIESEAMAWAIVAIILLCLFGCGGQPALCETDTECEALEVD